MKLFTWKMVFIGLFLMLALIGFINWDYVYGYVDSSPAGGEIADSTIKESVLPSIDCDYLLTDGLIVDGTGSFPYTGNVGIKGDTIVAVGDFTADSDAKHINTAGLVVSPGFIDIHTHTEDYWASGGTGEMVLEQGVTTHITGNCGTAPASIGKYLDSLQSSPINVGILVGYKSLRQAVIDKEPGKVGENEIIKMKEILAAGMREGAFGLSVGLGYYPQSLATGQELIELCQVVKDYNGYYATHIRSEEDKVISAVKEAISIGFKAGVPVQYSHVKVAGNKNWGKMPQVLQLIEEAQSQGLEITGDVYGYTYSSTDQAQNKVKESMQEEDMLLALTHPLIMIGSDSGLTTRGVASHPRAYANYSRILSLYVRDKKVLSLEQAVHKMTLMPAKRLNLGDRGMIAVGKKADLAVFNLDGVMENASRTNPNVLSAGMKYVFVNGKPALAEGEITGTMAGIPLRHSGE